MPAFRVNPRKGAIEQILLQHRVIATSLQWHILFYCNNMLLGIICLASELAFKLNVQELKIYSPFGNFCRSG